MCYAADPANNLGLGMDTGTADNVLVDTICGATGAAALTAADFVGPDALAAGTYANFDHIVIPGGQCNTPRPPGELGVMSVDRYCGLTLNCVQNFISQPDGYLKNAGTDAGTVCTSTKPFQVCVKTDSVEGALGPQSEVLSAAPVAAAGTRGFKMNYWQSSSCLLRN